MCRSASHRPSQIFTTGRWTVLEEELNEDVDVLDEDFHWWLMLKE